MPFPFSQKKQPKEWKRKHSTICKECPLRDVLRYLLQRWLPTLRRFPICIVLRKAFAYGMKQQRATTLYGVRRVNAFTACDSLTANHSFVYFRFGCASCGGEKIQPEPSFPRAVLWFVLRAC